MSGLPDTFVDTRLGDGYRQLIERDPTQYGPITLAQAMKFIRFAYQRGYTDSLTGIEPDPERSS